MASAWAGTSASAIASVPNSMGSSAWKAACSGLVRIGHALPGPWRQPGGGQKAEGPEHRVPTSVPVRRQLRPIQAGKRRHRLRQAVVVVRHALTGEHLRLPVQRQMLGELRHHDMGDQGGGGHAAVHDPRPGRSLDRARRRGPKRITIRFNITLPTSSTERILADVTGPSPLVGEGVG